MRPSIVQPLSLSPADRACPPPRQRPWFRARPLAVGVRMLAALGEGHLEHEARGLPWNSKYSGRSALGLRRARRHRRPEGIVAMGAKARTSASVMVRRSKWPHRPRPRTHGCLTGESSSRSGKVVNDLACCSRGHRACRRALAACWPSGKRPAGDMSWSASSVCALVVGSCWRLEVPRKGE